MAFLECGPLAEDSSSKLKSGQTQCVVYVRTVYSVPATAEICAGLACNFRQ
jgi:hypothetical protein